MEKKKEVAKGQRSYAVTIIVGNDAPTQKEGIAQAREFAEKFCGFKVKGAIKPVSDLITEQQMKAVHLYMSQLADALNEAGFDMRSKVVRADVALPWTTESIKEIFWRPVMKHVTGKKSTTKLEKLEEITQIYKLIDRNIAERTGITIPFPSIETLMDQDLDSSNYN